MISFTKSVQAAIKNPVLKNSDSISNDPNSYVTSVIQTIFSIFFIVATIYFIWHFVMSAYHMINSDGDPKKWEEAKKGILYAAVGLILVFSVFAVLKFAGTVFGIPAMENLQLIWPSL